MSWLVLEGDPSASSRKVLELVMSLGVPTHIGRNGEGVWGVRMANLQTASDAEWVLGRHIDSLRAALGAGARVVGVTNDPPTFTHTQTIHGRAEA